MDVILRASADQGAVPLSQIAEYLRPLPGVREHGDQYVFHDEEERVFFVVIPRVEEGNVCTSVVVRAPDQLVEGTRTILAGFAFNLAGHLNWEVRIEPSGALLADESALLRRLGGSAPPRAGCVTLLLACVLAPVLLLLFAR